MRRPTGPAFAPLAPAFAKLPADRWPTHAELTALAEGVVTSRGRPLRFVAPRHHTDAERRYYELHIADSGEVETRPENWHDLFNALAWITFPRAKAAINAQHAALLEEGGDAEARRRSPPRDALTVFDEGGLVVITPRRELYALIEDFAWKELFWTRRAELLEHMRFVAFGHALCEQALAPYKGMVAKTVWLPTDEDVDGQLARFFADRANFPSARALAPMPVLGIPGWHPRTDDESWYDDKTHFREATRP